MNVRTKRSFKKNGCPTLARAQLACQETQQLRDSLDMQVVGLNGQELLCDQSAGVLRPVVHVGWREAVFKSVHGLAHHGIRTTRRMVTSRYVWPSCASDMAKWCRDCQQCAHGKITQQEHTAVEAIPVPARRFSHVHVDLVGPLATSSQGHTYFLTNLDRTTRWP